MSLQNSLSKSFNNFKSFIFSRYSGNTDKFLRDTAAIGWILASMSNTLGVFFNKKIDSKQKKYLAAQEFADGITNVALFYGVTSVLMKNARKLVQKGIIGSKGLNKVEKGALEDGVGTIASLAGAVISNNILTPLIRNKVATYVQKKNLNKGINKDEVIVKPSSLLYDHKNNSLSIYNYMSQVRGGGNLKI